VRWLTLAALALLVAGCGETLRSAPQVSLPEPPKQAEVTPGTQREHQRILAAYGGAYENPRLEALITQTVDRLVAASERPNLKYKVTILNSSAVNAFALPNGQLYVTRGLLALANDTSELASVLSHEMAHVIARHAAIREDQARQDALLNRVAEINTDPQGSDRLALALARSKIKIASFSRAQELEADGIGVGISSRAGYDPYGAVRFLTAMGRNAELKSNGSSGDARFLDFLSSHPGTTDRLKVARANARQYTAPAEVGRADKEAYLAGINGLVYGEDPSEGFVRGRRFLHPRLAFTFTAPEGFTLENTAQAVLGVSQNGALALRLDVVRVPAEQTLSEYLTSGWIENVDERSVEALTINGFPAASATATGEQWTFRLYAVRFGSEVYRFIFAVKQKTADADRIFRESVATFRRMSLTEVERARPLHIQTVTVGAGDTVEKLAARMATDKPLERFLIINGLNHGDSLKAGDRVKIVVE
jgi:predicted Zn-dependent protease